MMKVAAAAASSAPNTARRVLVAAVAVLVLAALFEVMRVAASDITTHVSLPATSAGNGHGAPTVPASGTAAAAASAAPGGAVQPTAGHARSAGAATPRPPLPAASPPVDPGPLVPPQPGTFAYRWTINQQVSTGAISVARLPGPSDSVLETETTSQPGFSEVQTIDWNAAGSLVTASTLGTTPACQWAPPLKVIQSPLHPGETWQSDSSCRFTVSSGHTGTLHVVEQEKVDSLARTTTDGQAVQVFVIERHRLLTETAPGITLTTELQATDFFAPALGLSVFEVARTSSPNPDGTFTTTTTVGELLHTHPT